MKILPTLFLLIFTFQYSFGQNNEAKLIDEFSSIPCDLLITRLGYIRDVFEKESGNSKFYIAIYGDKNNPIEKYRLKIMLMTMWSFLALPQEKLAFLYGNDEQTLRIQFWVVPDKAKRPDINETTWNYVLPEALKPFVFHKKSWISEVCPDTFSYELYSSFLRANPNINGSLIIYERSSKKFENTKKELIKDLIQSLKVPESQIRFFYVQNYKSDIEYWLVPQKKKS